MAPQEESKLVTATDETTTAPEVAEVEASGDEEDVDAADDANPSGSASATKKKKKKKSKGKKTVSSAVAAAAAETLPKEVIDDIVKQNPALASELQGLDENQISELVRKMKLEEILTGMVSFIDHLMGKIWSEIGG